jgi:hypothetical protein
MSTVNRGRKKETKPAIAGPVRPAAVETLLRELDGLLERMVAEGKKCAGSQNDPPLSQITLLAARWLVTRRLLDLELAAKGTRITPGDTAWCIEDAWIKAVIESNTPERSFASTPNDRARDPLADLAQEIATYRAHLQEMAREHKDEFVLIKGCELVGFFPDFDAAIREGHRRFGWAPFLVKEVTFPERVIYLPNVVP